MPRSWSGRRSCLILILTLTLTLTLNLTLTLTLTLTLSLALTLTQPRKERETQRSPARRLPATLRSHGVCWFEGAVEGRRLRIYWAGNGEFFEGTIKASPPWQERQWDWIACD